MPQPLPPIDELLEMDPASFAEVMGGQPDNVKVAVRAELAQRMEALDRAAWGNSRKLRGHHTRFVAGKLDYERLEQTQQWLAGQFHDAFAIIYADAPEAAAKCWAYEQEHGSAQTARILKTAPAMFGALRGWTFLGFKSAARREALAHAAKFDFAAYRMVFTMASETGKQLIDALKEVARVATSG
ncbi:MAG: BID domain-containing protein [Pseudomonadaceae bacterium]|nr:BID domain-containing protein [Pseudomonadaceae bacterium]